MGNALVCLPPCSPPSRNNMRPRPPPAAAAAAAAPSRLVNVATGQVDHLHERVKVAEVMLDNPNTFVLPLINYSNINNIVKRDYSNSSINQLAAQQQSGSPSTLKRSFFEALPADQELEQGQLYLLLPMHKLNRRASSEEQAFLASLGAAYVNGPATAGGRRAKYSPCAVEAGVLAYESCDKLCPPDMSAASAAPPAPASFLIPPLLQRPCPGDQQDQEKKLLPKYTPRSKSWAPNLQTIREAPPAPAAASAAPGLLTASSCRLLQSMSRSLHRRYVMSSRRSFNLVAKCNSWLCERAAIALQYGTRM